MASSHFSHGSFEDLFVRDGAGDERRGSRQRHEEHSGQHAQFLFRPRASWRMVTVFSAGESQSESGCFERGASWSLTVLNHFHVYFHHNGRIMEISG